MTKSKRNQTIKAILLTAQGPNLAFGAVERELDAFEHCMSINDPRSRRLYEVFHLARAVDSAIKIVVTKFDPTKQPRGMGNGLFLLVEARPQYYDKASRGQFISTVSDPRNLLMHEADLYPLNDKAVNQFLSACQTCLIWVLQPAHFV